MIMQPKRAVDFYFQLTFNLFTTKKQTIKLENNIRKGDMTCKGMTHIPYFIKFCQLCSKVLRKADRHTTKKIIDEHNSCREIRKEN